LETEYKDRKHGDGVRALKAWGRGSRFDCGDDLMKFGIRKSSLKKRISARTSIKRQAVHRLGLKMPRGYGWVKNPKKFVCNKVYQCTSFDIFKLARKLFK